MADPLMSARDDQPATVPPPAGEDDAYSATTKVGAMPADIMEKLRAEGLLPEETAKAGDPVNMIRPSTSLDRRPMPLTEPSALTDARVTAPPPALYSSPPAAASTESTPEPALTGPATPLDPIETPVAFAFPPLSDAIPKVSEAAEEAAAGTELHEKTGATLLRVGTTTKDAPRPPSKMTLYVVAVLVVIALIVALIRLRG